jgi:hypothetical protein
MGGAAVHGLHAQGKPTAYVVGEVDVTNQDAFVKDYVPLAMKALGESGSGYKALAVGGRTSVIEGDPPKRRSASMPSRACHSEWHPGFGDNTGLDES